MRRIRHSASRLELERVTGGNPSPGLVETSSWREQLAERSQGPIGKRCYLLRMEFVLLALLILYLVPYTVAASREHPRVNWILWTNLLLGWTGLGWLVALAWSRSEPGGRVAQRWPWLHPERPSSRRHPHLRMLPGGLQEDDWTPTQAADSQD